MTDVNPVDLDDDDEDLPPDPLPHYEVKRAEDRLEQPDEGDIGSAEEGEP